MHWLGNNFKKLFQIKGTPRAIATGVAVGMFFGFIPLFGLKTLLAIGITWILRGNKMAAAIVVTLHDLLLPLLPVLLRLEYDLGYWILSHPHNLPPHLSLHHLEPGAWLDWSTFFSAGLPVLVGSVTFGIPIAGLVYFLTFWIWTGREKLKS